MVHVLDVGFERPVDGFGAEFDIAVLAEESFGVPGMIGRPFSHWGSEDEGFIAPGRGEFFWSEVFEAGNLVLERDVGCVGG